MLQPAPRLRPRRDLTLEAWAALGEDAPGELVDGHLVEEEVPDPVHELVVTWLAMTLRTWLRGAGFVLGSEAKLAVGPRRGRKADLSVFLPGGAVPPRRGLLRVAPDVVVEILSPKPRDTRRDRVEKAVDYARFGVPSYWLVDPELRTVEIFTLVRGRRRYVLTTRARTGRLDALPGLALELDALWAETDRLGPAEPRAALRRARPTPRRR